MTFKAVVLLFIAFMIYQKNAINGKPALLSPDEKANNLKKLQFSHGLKNILSQSSGEGKINDGDEIQAQKSRIPEYMLQLHKLLSKEHHRSALDGNVVRSYFDKGTLEAEHLHRQYLFNISDINDDEEEILKADLRIFKMSNPKQRVLSSYYLIKIKDVYRKETICAGITTSASHGWLIYPLTNIVKKWVRDPSKNHGIQIFIKSIYGDNNKVKFATKQTIRREPILIVRSKNKNEVTLSSLPDLQLNETLLKSFIDKATRRRERREVGGYNRGSCHVEPLRVPLHEVGWDENIAQPDYFTINQCKGTCWYDTAKIYERKTNHAIIQSMYAALTGGQKASFPCCAPAKYDEGTALIVSTTTIKLIILEKLTVTKCECM